MKKLAIICTHPVQYNAPWIRLLSERGNLDVKVFYTWSQVETEKKFDPGFGKVIDWDIPLLEGYKYSFVRNTSKKPGSKTRNGIKNPSLIKDIEAWNADAVLVFGWNFYSHSAAMKHFKGKIPVLFRGDSHQLDILPRWRSLLRKVWLRKVFRNVDYALYVGRANKEYYLSAGLKENQLIYAPHAVDNERFAVEAVGGVVDRPFLKDGKPVFLFAGKLEQKKDPEILLRLFKNKIEDANLVIVGNGPLEQDLKSFYGKCENIRFLDFRNQQQMPSVYKMADVLVLPSKGPGETWGLAVNEAMAASRPVIVSNKCGCAIDLVENGKTGFIFKSGNENDLAEKVRFMIENKSQFEEMGKKAFDKIQNWNFENIVIPIENLIKQEVV